MRKIYLLLALLSSSFLLRAQTTPVVSFSYTVRPGTMDVDFANGSKALGEGEKKAVWTFGDNTTASTGGYQGAFHRYTTNGTYRVCLKVYKNTTASSPGTLIGEACKEVVVQKPMEVCEAGFAWELDGPTPGKTIKFSGVGNSHPKKTIKRVCWDFGDNTRTCETVSLSTPPSTLLKVGHTYALPGTYNACIRIEYEGGCVAEKCKPVTIAAPPPANCEADFETTQLSATALGRKFVAQPKHSEQKMPVSICWKFGDGTPDVCKPYTPAYTGAYVVEHLYAQQGQYEVCITVTYEDGCKKKKCSVVTVKPPPSPSPTCAASIREIPVSAVASKERKFAVELLPNKVAKKIRWIFGDGKSQLVTLTHPVSPQQVTVVHSYASPGLYTVCAEVTYDGGCVAERCLKTIIGGHVRSSLVVSPNPVENRLTAVFQSSQEQPVSVRMYNTYGILVFQEVKKATVGTNTWSIYVGAFTRGTYSMVVQSPHQFATTNFFKH